MKPVSHCHKAAIKEDAIVSEDGSITVKITCSKCGEECAISHGGLKKDEVEAFAEVQKNLGTNA